MEQRTLLGRGVSSPKWRRQAAFECPESSLGGRLLRRTSENNPYEHFIEGTSANRLSQKFALSYYEAPLFAPSSSRFSLSLSQS